MKEAKSSFRKGFQDIKKAATSLTSPRNATGTKKKKETDSATNFIEKNLGEKIEQQDLDFLFASFDHPRSEFALKAQYGKKINAFPHPQWAAPSRCSRSASAVSTFFRPLFATH